MRQFDDQTMFQLCQIIDHLFLLFSIETHETKNGIGTLFNGNSKLVNERFRHWYRGISNFSEVENQPNMLVCWIAGDSARIADQLDDDEVKHM